LDGGIKRTVAAKAAGGVGGGNGGVRVPGDGLGWVCLKMYRFFSNPLFFLAPTVFKRNFQK